MYIVMSNYPDAIPFLNLPSLLKRREIKFYIYNIFACLFLTSVAYPSQEAALPSAMSQTSSCSSIAQIDSIKKSAQQGDAKAQCNLGIMYSQGQGIAKDDREAFKWLSKAAEQQYAPAQLELGVLYSQGRGIKEDLRKAFELFFLRPSNNVLRLSTIWALFMKKEQEWSKIGKKP